MKWQAREAKIGVRPSAKSGGACIFEMSGQQRGSGPAAQPFIDECCGTNAYVDQSLANRACKFGERQEFAPNVGPWARKMGHFQGCLLAAWGCIRPLSLAEGGGGFGGRGGPAGPPPGGGPGRGVGGGGGGGGGPPPPPPAPPPAGSRHPVLR